jgi:hypothetical protein
MTFDSLVASMDDIVAATFAKTGAGGAAVTVTLHPKDGSPDITVPCVIKNPVMEEDYVPGLQTGTATVILFISSSLGLEGVMGWTATFGESDYNVEMCDVDRCGGLHIKMRRRTQPWYG